jgi:lipoprotein LpqH
VTAQSVDFRDFGGFTGSYWNGNIGEAKVTATGGKYTIDGSADGSFTDNPSNAVTTTFRIEANC